MRILVIDDNRVFTEPLVWRLEREEYDVVYCQTVSEVLDGWFEVTEQALELLRGDGVPDSVVDQLRFLALMRFDRMELLEHKLRDLPGSEDFATHMAMIEQRARQDPLTPVPDCIVLDLMMPRDTRYTKRETDAARSTGTALLRDVLKRIGSVPVVVVTVRDEPECHMEVRKRFSHVVKSILVKPVTPQEVLNAIDDAFGITRKES